MKTRDLTLKTIIMAFVISVAALLGAVPAFAADAPSGSDFAGGTGTESDPYIISNASQLQAFRDSVNSANTYEGMYVALSSDIDISGQQWIPIGTAKRSGNGIAQGSNSFAGVFDGGGHTINGLTITPSGTQAEDPDYALGLFGAVMGGTVENLNLSDVKISCSLGELEGGAVGLLSNSGTVSNVTVSGQISGKSGIGGVVGRMTANGTISECTNNAAVTELSGTGNIGGIVGAAYYVPEGSYMSIDRCINNGTISGANDVGGIVGLCCAFVSDCTNNGLIAGSSYATGGIAGEIKNYGGVVNSTNSADITNSSSSNPYGVGGIVGWVRYNGAAPAYALSENATIANNVNTGSVKTKSAIGVGGIVGVLYSSGTVTGNENTAKELSGKQFIGGIVGNLQDQGAASLPPSIKEGAIVNNNVSITQKANMNGDLADTYAYNNDPSIFVVKDNGDSWVATDTSTGDMKYATLDFAVENAADGATVTLISDSENNKTLEPIESNNITIDLNGHNIGFSSEGRIVAAGETVTITGDGNLYAKDSSGEFIQNATIFLVENGVNGEKGSIKLKGGSYPTDVSKFVADGYEVVSLASPNEFDNQYEVELVPMTPTTNPNDTGAATTPTVPSSDTSGSNTGNVNHSTRSSNSDNGSSTIANNNVSGNGSTVAGHLNATSDYFAFTAIWVLIGSLIALAGSIVLGLTLAHRGRNSR